MKIRRFLLNIDKRISEFATEAGVGQAGDERPSEPEPAHNGHTLPDCAPGRHECYMADAEQHVRYLEGLKELPPPKERLNRRRHLGRVAIGRLWSRRPSPEGKTENN